MIRKYYCNCFLVVLVKIIMMHAKENDLRLFLSLKENNRKSLNVIFLKYYDPLLAFGKNFLNENDAEEIVLDVFFNLWQKKEQLQIKDSLKAYLFASVRNGCINELNKKKLKTETIEKSFLHKQIKEQQQPDDILLYEEVKIRFNRLLEELPDQCKLIFKLSRDEQLSHKEISTILNISVNTVNTQIYRALKFFKSRMQSEIPA